MDPTEIAFTGAAQQVRMLAAGAITAPDLLTLYLERIARLDPELNAFRVVLTQDARSQAQEAQRRLDSGERTPLLGVPIAVKDDIDVAGQVTARGTSAHGPASEQDAEVVRRLRAAGAVIMGKTNVPEMTIWPFTETLTFGATRNPWDPSRSPGGSSGGMGAAVAAGLVGIGLGSDGGGSIRIPGTWCGLFGLKPQRDRVPTTPNEDAGQGLTVYGPLTRTVEDAALFLDVTATTPGPDGGFVAAAGREPGRLRIAISTKVPPGVLARAGSAQRAAVQEAAALLRGLGHTVVLRDPDYPPTAGAHFTSRFVRGVSDEVARLPHPERLEARTRVLAYLGSLIDEERMASIRAGESAVTGRVMTIFDDIDVLVTPGAARGPSRIGAYQRRGVLATLTAAMTRVPYQGIFNVTGQPAAVVPWGLDGDGLPMSVQLVSRPSDEATLLSLCAQVERARPWADRRPPIS